MSDQFNEIDTFLTAKGLVVIKWSEVNAHSQVLDIKGYCTAQDFCHMDLLIYVRTDRTQDWWGVSETIFNQLVSSGREWQLVLLRDGERGYVLDAALVQKIVPQVGSNATQYVLHEKEARDGISFFPSSISIN